MQDIEGRLDAIPLAHEELHVAKRTVEADHVRVRTTVDDIPVSLSETIQRGELVIDRIRIDREVQDAPTPRREGDTTIISLVEERLVVVRKLFVVEEVRIRAETVVEPIQITDTVRRARAVIERVERSPTGEDDG